MAPAGSPHEDKDKRINLKRRRPSIEDETENIPPVKKSSGQRQDYFLEEELCEPAYDVVIEASSSDDEDHQTNNQEFKCPDIDFDADTLFSPSPSGEQPNYVLSPLENVARGDSTPHSSKRQASTSKPDCTLPCLVNEKRKCPLPVLSWADPEDVWMSMCRSDIKSKNKKSENMFDNHPHLQPRMRAILLDWLNEVCEVYKLHRETYHLTVDYIDRYLSATEDVLGSRLQLIGITCLFIAAKVEEVYPPKLREFAYVTDGACTEKEILLEEKHVLNILTWDITPITVISWLNVYLQLAGEGKSAQSRLIGESDPGANSMRGYTFAFPQYSSLDFVVCGQLLDLAVLDVDVNKYSYSVTAAAAVAHCFNKELALRVSGCTWDSLEACFRWLTPFAAAVRAEGTACAVRGGDAEFVQRAGHLRAVCPALNADESHRVQTHNVTLDMFDQVCQLQLEAEQTATQTETLPSTSQDSAHVIYPPTPPQSDQKSPKTPTTKTPCNRKQSECAGVAAPENRLTEVD